MDYKKRHIEDTLLNIEKGFKAVLLTGPRQVGKSTMLKNVHKDRTYITFDNPVLLEETKREPGLFFKNNRPPIILDEVQYITDLFPYVKMECDNIQSNGMINMTGSQQFQLMKNVSESLAGRIAILELSGLSLRELNDDSFRKPFIPDEEYIEERGKMFRHILIGMSMILLGLKTDFDLLVLCRLWQQEQDRCLITVRLLNRLELQLPQLRNGHQY